MPDHVWVHAIFGGHLATGRSPFTASSATRAWIPTSLFWRFLFHDLLILEDQNTSDGSFHYCLNFGGQLNKE
jgi:hypothetical protein